MAINRIEYTVLCPECQKTGNDYTMGFNLENGRYDCSAPQPHEFDQLPGETDSVLGEILPHEPNATETVIASEPERTSGEDEQRLQELTRARATQPVVPEFTPTPAEVSAAVSAVEQQAGKAPTHLEDISERLAHGDTTAISELLEILSEDAKVKLAKAIARGVPPPMYKLPIEAVELLKNSDMRPGAILGHPVPMEMVGVGEFAQLPGGDIVCGIRISEQFASGLQAEAECMSPPQNAAEYLQGLVDQGMLEWFSPIPSVTRGEGKEGVDHSQRNWGSGMRA